MNVECAISILLLFGTSGAVNIVVPPDNACACVGEDVQFNCTAEETVPGTGGGMITRVSAQRWEIEPSSGPTIMVDSATPSDNPAGYEIVLNNSGDPIGLRVLTPDLSLNQASFTCIGYEINDPTEPVAAAPAVTLEITELSAFGFSCDALCPQHYSSTNNQCAVEWTGPVAASCNTLTGYTVTINGTEVGAVDNTTSSHVTGVLEPFQSYTATVTAVSSCNSVQCSLDFVSPKEKRPTDFRVNLLFNTLTSIVISTEYTMTNPPRVREFSVVVRDDSDQEVLGQTFSGDSSSLSLDISSLQQCMNYTVSVTATNTGGSTTASAMLSLDFITALNVLCVVGDADCYLEATYVTDHPELVSVCTLNYTREGGPVNTVTQTHSTSSDRITLRATVPCENQTIFYEGYVHDQHMNTLGCTHSGMTVCPLGCAHLIGPPNGTVSVLNGSIAIYSCSEGYALVGEETRMCQENGNWSGDQPVCQVICPPLPSLPHGSVSYSSVSVGSMAVYSCDTGYLLEGNCHRLCQNSGQWSGAQPHCKDSVSPWFAASIFLLVYAFLSTIVIVALTLKMFVDRKRSGSHSVTGSSSRTTHETVELSENVCYGPVAPPQSGATQTVEYEEIGAPTATTTGKTPAEKKQ